MRSLGPLTWSCLAALLGLVCCSASEQMSMVMLGPPPVRIGPPPKPQWLRLDYSLSCSEEGVDKQPGDHSASAGSFHFRALILSTNGSCTKTKMPEIVLREQETTALEKPSSWLERLAEFAADGFKDDGSERVRYIIVVVLAILTIICIGLTIALIYLKRRYLKYQIYPDAPSEETNFLWNYSIRGLRWTRYRSSETSQVPCYEHRAPQHEEVPPQRLSPVTEFTDMSLDVPKRTPHSRRLAEKLELKERCNSCTSSGISLSNSDMHEEDEPCNSQPDVVASTFQPTPPEESISQFGEILQKLAEGFNDEGEGPEITEAPTMELRRPLKPLPPSEEKPTDEADERWSRDELGSSAARRPLRFDQPRQTDDVMPYACTEDPSNNRQRRRRRRRKMIPTLSSPSSSPSSTLSHRGGRYHHKRPPPHHKPATRHVSIGYESDNEIEV